MIQDMERGFTGGLLERELLGEISSEKIKEYPDLVYIDRRPERLAATRHITPREALRLVEKLQPWMTTAPLAPLAADLYESVAKLLGMKRGHTERLHFYTCISPDAKGRTHMDVYHGGDAVMRLIGPEGKDVFVTIDLTLNENIAAGKRTKTDVVIVWPVMGLDPDLDSEAWGRHVAAAADDVYEALMTKTLREEDAA